MFSFMEVQLTKKNQEGKLLLEMHFTLLILSLQGPPMLNDALNKLPNSKSAVGLSQWFSTLAVYYNHLGNWFKKTDKTHSKPLESASLRVG